MCFIDAFSINIPNWARWGAGENYLETTHTGMRRIDKLGKLQSRTFLLRQPPIGYYLDHGGFSWQFEKNLLFLHLQFCCVMSAEAEVIKPYLIFRRGLQDLSELQTINSLTSNMVSSCRCGKYVSTNKNDSGFICLPWLWVYFRSRKSGSHVAIATAEGKTKPGGMQWWEKKENG